MAGQTRVQRAQDLLEAFNRSDWEQCRDILGNGVYNEIASQRRLQGSDQILQAWQGWKQAMPDVKGTVTSAVGTGHMVVLEVTWQGTHTGPLQTPGGTVPPSGKGQSTQGAWLFDCDGNRLKESRHYFDMLFFLQQIGVMPQ